MSALKYYYNHKEKVLDYKRHYYSNKVKKFREVKNFTIIGINKSTSNKLIKSFLSANRLHVCINNTSIELSELENYNQENKLSKCLGVFKNDTCTSCCEFLTPDECIEFINHPSNQLYLHFYIH